MAVQIPFSIVQKGKTLDQQMAQQAARAEREAIASTRRQIAEQQRLARLTAKLDRDIANEQKRSAQVTKEWGQAALVAFGVLAKAGSDAVAAARESAASDRELLGILNSTGKGAAGFKDQLSALATELEDNSNFTDEAIQHAEGLLLTFDKVGKDVIPRATQAVADLAELMDGDLQGAAQAVGKALDGQVSALKRSGVTFTKSQEDQIDALFKAGKAAQAQDIILDQLEKKVSGQAKAAREAAGGLKDMQVAAGRLQESMGSLLLTIGDGGFTDFATGFLTKLDQGAKAWEGAIENMRILAEARERAAKDQGIQASAPRGAFGQIRGDVIDNEALAKAVQEVAKEHEEAKRKLEEQTTALNTNTEATDENAAAQDDLANHLEKVNNIRRDTARDLIDIDQKAQADTAAAWDDYFKEEADAWKDHSKAVDKINADSEKERVRIQKDLARSLLDIDKDLAKDMAKIDKDLARDKAKLQRDTEKQIGRMQQDAAREAKQQRRAAQIDAKADQRLFDFEMRQLAAEGEFNQILAAKERRAIEKQIDAEKAAEEQRTQQENRKVEIDRARQDAQDRMRELEAEAEEQRQMRQEQAEEARQEAIAQAEEAEARRQEELAQALADEQANYEERMEALRQARDEKLAEIEETKKQSIAKLGEELSESKELTREEMEAMKGIAEELGPETGAAFADGLNEGLKENLRITDIVNDAMRDAGTGVRDTSRPDSRPGAINRGITTSDTSHAIPARPTTRRGFASGVDDFLVPPGFPNDSYTVGLTSGERVSVAPAGQGGASVIVNVNGPGGKELAAIMEKYAKMAVKEYHDTIISPWTNAG